jgi:DNA-binding NarL/FixJ family response regulator
MTKRTTRVLIAEDTEIGRRGLRDMFETADDILPVGETDSVHSIPRLIKELSPDVLLMDLKWYDDESAGWIKISEIKREIPGIKIIAITAYPHLIAQALKSGADQVVTKNLKRDDLLELIRTVSLRRTPVQYAEPTPRGPQDQISPRELEVLILLDKGFSDKEISKALNIELNTAKNHVKSILQKLNSESRGKASSKARELGIIK